jgi:hypothetical protein
MRLVKKNFRHTEAWGATTHQEILDGLQTILDGLSIDGRH